MTDEAFDRWWAKFEGKTWTTERGARMVWKAAIKAEREACAKVCDKAAQDFNGESIDAIEEIRRPVLPTGWQVATDCAVAIRARNKAVQREAKLKTAEERIAELKDRLYFLTRGNIQ